MVDIQSATTEIRRGKKEERRGKEPQLQNIMSASATQGGHKNSKSARNKTHYSSVRVIDCGVSPEGGESLRW